MMISGINSGVCQRRLQEGKPAFFVNWTEEGENKYKFFSLRWVCEDFKDSLKLKQNKP